MNGYLRQSTAAQVRTIGAFISDTDFKTLSNALTIANTDIVVSINGGADTVKNSGGATAHGAGGIYTLTWDTTDSASVGELFYSVKVAGALAVWGTYVVLEEAAFDAIFAAAAPGPATPTNITAGTITTATNLTNERGKYANGAVWVGPSANTNTVSYVDGIITNPVSTIAAAKTVADALGLRRFYTVRTGTVQLGADHVGYDFDGANWSLTTTGGSRDVSASHFIHANVVGGAYLSTSAASNWEDCEFATGVSVAAVNMMGCRFAGTLTLTATGNHDFIDCASIVAGTAAPVFDLGSVASQNLSFRRWSGGMTLSGIVATSVISVDAVSGGTITLNGVGGTVHVRGMVTVTDARTGTPTLVQTQVVNQRTLGIMFSARIATLASQTSFTLTDGSSDDSAYVQCTIIVTDSATAQQKAIGTVSAYTGVTKTVTLAADPAIFTMAVGDFITILPATSTAATIADAVWDEDATAHQTQGTFGQAIGDPAADTNTIYKAVVTDATGATVGVDVVAVKAETVSIQADTDNLQTRIPAALVGGRIDASVGAMAAGTVTAAAIATDAIDADALAADAVTEIQAGLATPTNITAGTITTVTNLTNAPTVGDLTAAMKASVNAEVLDVLVTDTFAEPAAVPAATASLKDKIGWQAAVARNKITQTATTQLVRNDADAATIGTSTVSDDGVTATRGEFV